MKKKKIEKPDKTKVLYIIIIALVLLIFLYSFRAYQHYTLMKLHREYFKQPNLQIEPWMTVHSISRHFNISENAIFQELKTKATISNSRTTIESMCKKNHLNCTETISGLNALKKP